MEEFDMDSRKKTGGLTRRGFLRGLAAAVSVPYLDRFPGLRSSAVLNDVFWVKGIPDHPFYDPGQPNFHVGLDSLLHLLADPDRFDGEVVIVENGQGRGNLSCATTAAYGGDSSVHANANDESHHFLYLVDKVFSDRRVSAPPPPPLR